MPARNDPSSASSAGGSRVEVHTGARLHFGLLADQHSQGRSFGGCGLMLDQPGCHLTIQRPAKPSANPGNSPVIEVPETVDSPHWYRERVQHAVDVCLRHLAATTRGRDTAHPVPPESDQLPHPGQFHIDVHSAIPPHRGLGAGTQLALSVAAGISALCGLSHQHPYRLAQAAGRGLRSAVGLHGFIHGGFLVDGGKQQESVAGSLAARIEFPAAWRIVLITPVATQGASGVAERRMFRHSVHIPESVTARLCHQIVMELLPALAEGDFSAFSRSLYEYGCTAGDCFAKAQGGRFCSREVEQIVAQLRQAGIHGVGQSSWGPTVFALCPTPEAAAELEAAASTGIIPGAGRPLPCRCTIRVATPLNRGAEVQIDRQPL